MLKQTITYTDYNNVERTETFHFNLTKTEVTVMNLSTEGGMEELIKKIVETKDTRKIIEMFQDLILKAYGEKSPDGKRFIKSPELSEAFAQTEAYSELFMKLASEADAAAAFVNGIIPQVPQQPTK